MNEVKTSVLYLGDNLEIIRMFIPDNCIDLIYLDPPFGSNRNYITTNSKSTEKTSSRRKQAFSDSWSWNAAVANSLKGIVQIAPLELGKLIQGMVAGLGPTPLAGYLVMMIPRILELHRILKDTGSLYLHCDPTASHYLKIVLDYIFGIENFRNEIVWSYNGGGRSKKYFARKHDTILFYSKSNNWAFNYNDILVNRTNRTYFIDEKGRKYWRKYGKKYYFKNDGKIPEDWWIDITPLDGPYKERLGYPTQKPIALLERIIKVASNRGDVVLDPFCGSGTTLVTAQKLDRNWIGIDNNPNALDITNERLKDSFPETSFKTVNLPEGSKTGLNRQHTIKTATIQR